MRALVVDPEALSRNLMRVALERLGIVTEAATTLSAAEVLLRAREFDVVCTDGGLPSDGGLNLLRRLRRARWRGSCVYTADLITDTQLQELSREIIARAVFAKPLALAEVETRLSRAIPGATPGQRSDEAHVPPSWSGALRKARKEYAARLPTWVQELALNVEAARDQKSGKHLAEARRLCTALATEAERHAFPIVAETSEAIGQLLDDLLAGRKDLGARAVWDRVETLQEIMDASLSDAASAIATVSTDQFEQATQKLLFVSPDLELLRRAADWAARHDAGLLTARSIKEAARVAMRRKFDGAFLAEGLPDGGTSMLAEWLRRQPGMSELPIAVLVSGGGPQVAGAAKALGGTFTLPLPIDEQGFVGALARLARQKARRPARVLLVDDDPEFGEASRRLFHRHGLTLVVAPTASGLVERLDELRPDLIIADVVLPIVSGIELCRQVRAAPDWSGVPVLLTSTQDTPAMRLAAARAGADALLLRPVADEELVGRTLATIERLRALRETDPLTGVLTRPAFLRALRDALGDGHRAVAVGVLDVDYFHQVNELYGLAAGDKVLAGLAAAALDVLGDEAILGRWDADQLVVALPNESRSGALTRLTRVAQKVRGSTWQGGGKRFQVSVQLGVTASDRTGANLETLLRDVEHALRAAKSARG